MQSALVTENTLKKAAQSTPTTVPEYTIPSELATENDNAAC